MTPSQHVFHTIREFNAAHRIDVADTFWSTVKRNAQRPITPYHNAVSRRFDIRKAGAK